MAYLTGTCMTAELIHRLHFAFTITFHYLFPQLTMGLALLIVVLKTVALRAKDPAKAERWDKAALFWGRIFGINFVMGVVTGIPMEFEFGTNWARFARVSGGVIGQPLAMEGVFSFFLESAFLGLFLYGGNRLSKRLHWFSAFMVFVGSWISGFFIIVTDAWMQHPVSYNVVNGRYEFISFWGILLNPWGLLQYAHNMTGAVITGSFVMAAVGAFYLLDGRQLEYGRIFLKIGVVTGFIASVLIIFPTGDLHSKFVARNQPTAMAGMEGLFRTERGAGVVLMGQPNEETGQIDNPIVANNVLSFLIYGTTRAEVRGLDQFPRDQWPTALPLLFYSYHIMAGLGTWFLLLMTVCMFLLTRHKLFSSRWALWALLISFPLPYIAATAGWMTTELGRQPWVIYGLMRTSDGYSETVSAGNGLFTLIGFMGMYLLLGLLFTVLVYREINRGPEAKAHAERIEAAAH
jgi:cytochrome bd ubiquinol oxidase subunit I